MQIRPQIWLVAALGLLLALGVASWGTSGDDDVAETSVLAMRGASYTETRARGGVHRDRRADVDGRGDRMARNGHGGVSTDTRPAQREHAEAVRVALHRAQRRGAERATEHRVWDPRRWFSSTSRGGTAGTDDLTEAATEDPASVDAPYEPSREELEHEYGDRDADPDQPNPHAEPSRCGQPRPKDSPAACAHKQARGEECTSGTYACP